MITATQISKATFTAVKHRGESYYDHSEVDAFLDMMAKEAEVCAEDFSKLEEENRALAAERDSLLSDKDSLSEVIRLLRSELEDYHRKESAINGAMLQAQEIRDRAEIDARARAEEIISDAQKREMNSLAEVAREIEAENLRLEDAKKLSGDFFSRMSALCSSFLSELDKAKADVLTEAPEIPEIPETPEIPEIPETSESPDDKIRIPMVGLSGDSIPAEELDIPDTKSDEEIDPDDFFSDTEFSSSPFKELRSSILGLSDY